MISRLHRFHGHNSLRYVYQHGQVVRGSLFSIKATVNDRQKSYRAAVVVSKKVSKSAVTRNRIRRRLYEQLRLVESGITDPIDIVITVFSDQAATASVADLAKQLQSQLRQAHVLHTVSTPGHAKIEDKGE